MVLTQNVPLTFKEKELFAITPLGRGMEGLCLHITAQKDIILEVELMTSADGGKHFIEVLKEEVTVKKGKVALLPLSDKLLFNILQVKLNKYPKGTQIMLCHGGK